MGLREEGADPVDAFLRLLQENPYVAWMAAALIGLAVVYLWEHFWSQS